MRTTKAVCGILWRFAKRLVVGALALVLILALTGLVYQALSTRRDARRYPPPGKLVDVGGYRLHIHSMGEGGPTVVFESGLANSSLWWFAVQPEVAKFARACCYDRAGLGWSDASPSPRTSKEIVRELHTLLANAGIPGPYVLVGHSLGGFHVRLFAHEYPQETAGIVLVDSTHEDIYSKLPVVFVQRRRERCRLLLLRQIVSPFGVVRLFYIEPETLLPVSLRPVEVALCSRTTYVTTYRHEMLSFDESAAQVRAGSSLPQVPLAVVSGGREGSKPPPGISIEDWERDLVVHRDLQADLARRCTNSIHLTEAKSSHYVQCDAPALVVEAVRRVVEAARDNKPIQALGQ